MTKSRQATERQDGLRPREKTLSGAGTGATVGRGLSPL